jgi:ADP-ribosylglycohydrolase
MSMDYAKLRMLLAGLATGDSLGSTSEFVPQKHIPDVYKKNRHNGWPFAQAGGGSFNWRPGEATDDTDMAMCLVRAVLADDGAFNGETVAGEFIQWMASHPPDIGGTTRATLSSVRDGAPWQEGGLGAYRRNRKTWANGSLMRNGVLPALAEGDDLYANTLHHGMITHYAPLPQLCCLLQSWRILQLLNKREPFKWNWMDEFKQDLGAFHNRTKDEDYHGWSGTVDDYDEAWHLLQDAEFDPDKFSPFFTTFAGRSGYCLLTLQVALWAVQWAMRGEPYPEKMLPRNYPREPFAEGGWNAIGWVALVGYDSDTYGAAAGPLIAAALGEPPTAMQEGLEALDEFDALVEDK